MKLHNLKPAEGSTSEKIRKGRGTATGRGKTAGRGENGQKSRSGGGVRLGFEGGQMPLTRRIPKRGFSNYPFKQEAVAVNLDKLAAFQAGSEVTVEALKEKGIIKNKVDNVKLLANGEVKNALTIKLPKVSKAAKAKIEAAGGTIQEV